MGQCLYRRKQLVSVIDSEHTCTANRRIVNDV
ncbi:Uncharacterised protein [Vibrio cholerae]|nr:Uncharacterised protein [Vibrio cholerae]CSD43345.1 Uncharacterised protein [Vibrio cholerae]CSD48471.1 Uncharacterised protein [Vibrio cholerae]CSI35835.1 Uncharacterised protein [Vibrio cholerae]CSI38518.1 Uncharacterised protein [Vibrio cholerae]